MKEGVKDHYQILGLTRDASSEEIKRAYHTYAAKLHPDKHEGDVFFEERFVEVKNAFEILSDPEARTRYDIKKFGRSRAPRESSHSDLKPINEIEKTGRKRKLQVDISHLDVYLTLLYVINLAAWVMTRRIQDHSSSGGHIWSLFLTGVSTMLMWLFITSLIDLINHRYTGQKLFLLAYLLLSLLIACIPLWTMWIP